MVTGTTPRTKGLALGTRLRVAVGVGTVLALAFAAGAYAVWLAFGSGAGSGDADTLGASTVTTAPGAGTVHLTWTAVSPPGPGTMTYYVARDGAPADGDCPTVDVPATTRACTDSGLAAGSYNFTVTAVWHSWTATSAAEHATLVSGAFDHFSLAAADMTPAAGADDNLTISAVDADGTPITTYTGSHSLTFAGASSAGSDNPTVTNSAGTAVDFGSATELTFSAGVATVSGSANGVMRLYKVETATITASEGGIYPSDPLSVTVHGGSIALFSVPTPGSQVAGTPFAISITARDAYGNTATYAGSQCLAFSGPGASPNETAPTYPARGSCEVGQSAVTFSAGVAAAVSITLTNASETTTLTVTDVPSDKTGSTGTFAVTPGALSKFIIAAADTTPVAGAADNLTITAVDAQGNPVPSYAGSHDLTFAGANPAGSDNPTVTNAAGTAVDFGSTTELAFGAGVATVSGSANGVMRLYAVETATITASEGGSYTSDPLPITVHSSASLKAQYKNDDSGTPTDLHIMAGLQVINMGTASVDLSSVTIRYWFTKDAGASTYMTWCDYAFLSCSNVTEQVVALVPSRTGADAYLEVGFGSGAGSLAAGAATGDVMARFNKTDWTSFIETDDYSYGTNTTYLDWTKVTVYVDGTLVWGTEP